jgi:hypothetical protein
MQFDKTRITVRERSFVDIMDLALQVIREHAWPLAVALAVGIVPFAVLNGWVLNYWVVTTLEIDPDYDQFEYNSSRIAFVFFLLLLVTLEIPLATAFATLYLGNALFEQSTSPRKIALDFFRSLPQLLLFQVFVRALTVPMVVTLFIPFAFWPYLNEVILLERNPLRKKGGGLSTFSRSSNLHAAGSGDLFGRWLASLAFGVLWVWALGMAIGKLRTELTGIQTDDWASYIVYFQLVIWIVVGYFAVVRFLSYLDLRIRTEGWEVELRLRAEAARLARVESGSS